MNTTVKIGKNPNILQGMNRQSSAALHTMQSYSTIKRKIYWYTERHGWTSKTHTHTQSKRSQTQNTVHYRFTWHSGKTEIYGMKKLSNSCQRLGARGCWKRMLLGWWNCSPYWLRWQLQNLVRLSELRAAPQQSLLHAHTEHKVY